MEKIIRLSIKIKCESQMLLHLGIKEMLLALTSFLSIKGKNLHCQTKEVERDVITLSQSMCALEKPGRTTID